MWCRAKSASWLCLGLNRSWALNPVCDDEPPPVPAGQSFQYSVTTRGRLDTPEQFSDIVIKIEGCYHPDHLAVKQKVDYLDEQQAPGNHLLINRNGGCESYEPLDSDSLPKLPLGLSIPGLVGALLVAVVFASCMFMARGAFQGLLDSLL